MVIRNTSLGLLMAASLFVAACGEAPGENEETTAVPAVATTALEQQALEEKNKAVVLEFFRDGITPDERYELMHPDYIQHNPVFKKFGELNATKGREEFKLLQQYRAQQPPAAPQPSIAGRPANDPRYLVMAEGDVVTVIQKRYQPDPLNPGDFYESFWYDTWRVKDGKLYEHWDPATIDASNIPDFLTKPVNP